MQPLPFIYLYRHLQHVFTLLKKPLHDENIHYHFCKLCLHYCILLSNKTSQNFCNFECPTKHLLISCKHPNCELHSPCVNLNLQIDLNGTNQCICVVSSWLIQLLTFYCQFLTCYVSIATKEPLVILMIPNDRLTGPVWRDIFSEG